MQPWMTLLGQRLGLSAEELEALRAGDGYRVLAPRFADQPLMLAALQMLEQQRAPAQVKEDDEELGIPPEPGLRRALRAAARVNHYTASVLGACACWGQIDTCPRCHGRGHPGFRASADPAMLVGWVEPALRRIGLRIVADPDVSDVPPTSTPGERAWT